MLFRNYFFNKEQELINEIAHEKFSWHMFIDGLKLAAMIDAGKSINDLR